VEVSDYLPLFVDTIDHPTLRLSSTHPVWGSGNPVQTRRLQCQVGGVKTGSRPWRSSWGQLLTISMFHGHYQTVSGQDMAAAACVERNGL